MRICYLAAANSVHSYRWIRYFAEAGHEVHWISLTPSDFPALRGVCFYDLSSRWGAQSGLAAATLRIRGLTRSIRPDLLHAHYAGSYGLLGAISGIQPFVLTAWGSDVLLLGRTLVRSRLIRWILRRARLITCDAYHMIEALKGLGASAGKVRLVCFGVESDRFSPGPGEASLRENWRMAGRRVIISLRSLEPIYDVRTLLEAAPRVLEARPATGFVIAGAGSDEGSLRERAARLGVSGSVRFIGRYANTELPAILRCSDVYVSTSLSDAGISASTAEAMACGIPVVVSDTGENARWIEHGRSGYLFPPGDAAALAARILDLLADEVEARKMAAAARAVIVERNSYSGEMEKMGDLYRALVAGPGSSGAGGS